MPDPQSMCTKQLYALLKALRKYTDCRRHGTKGCEKHKWTSQQEVKDILSTREHIER